MAGGFITAATVAELAGFSNDRAFLAARERLERETLFPRPMPTCLRPLLWRRSEVEAWLEEQGTPAPPPPAGPNVVLMAEARRA